MINGIMNDKWRRDGIHLLWSDNNIIAGNRVTDSGGHGIYLDDSDNNWIISNTLKDSSSDGVAMTVSQRNSILGNVIEGGEVGVSFGNIEYSLVVDGKYDYDPDYDPFSNVLNFNSITDTEKAGLEVNSLVGTPSLNATLNWWGSSDGPTVDWNGDNDDDELDYDGGGDRIIGPEDSVAFSPWLGDSIDDGKGIDTAPNTPGVQFPETVRIIVDDIGPSPGEFLPGIITPYIGLPSNVVSSEDHVPILNPSSDPVTSLRLPYLHFSSGYLGRAIMGANVLGGNDILEVRNGTYTSLVPIWDTVTMIGKDKPTIDSSIEVYRLAGFVGPIFGGGINIITGGSGSRVEGFKINPREGNSPGSVGVLLALTDDNQIYSNEVNDNIVGIALFSANNNYIGSSENEELGNYIHGNAIGVGLLGVSDVELPGDPLSFDTTGNSIGGNQITENILGVGLLGASDNLIENNDISNNLIGIADIGTDNATPLLESLFGPVTEEIGVLAINSLIIPDLETPEVKINTENNTIKGNRIEGNEFVGIGLLNSDSTRVENNTIKDTSSSNRGKIGFEEILIPENVPGIGIALSGTSDAKISKNIIEDNDIGILDSPNLINPLSDTIRLSTGNSAHFNSIVGNDIGVRVKPIYSVDGKEMGINATLNWWGTSDGPTVDWGNNDNINYNGGGDTIVGPEGSVYFSPWLGIDPDTGSNNGEPGVQLPDSMTFIVDDVGPAPDAGYLITALDAAASLPYPDTIRIRTDENQDDYNDVKNRSIEEDIVVPSGESGAGLLFRRNWFPGSLTHHGTGTVDALFNYWGSPPNVKGNIEDMLLSPWLLEEPGTENMRYKVASMGADPEGGLTRAIADANDDTFEDEIIVDKGTYNVSNSTGVAEPTNIVTCTGCPTAASIYGELVIEASEVNVGGWEKETYDTKGFNINADVTVRSGVDTSNIHINWNNIYGTVTNNASGTLDATYNWWGNKNPDDSTAGDVDVTPFLPNTVCSVLDYMGENGIEDPKNAVAAMICGAGSSSKRAICELTGMGLDVDGASSLIQQYGLGRVVNAMENSTTSSEFVELLGGYSLPAGAAGGLTNNILAGGAGSVGGRPVGAVFTKCETIEVNFPLADFQGNPSRNLTPTVSLVKLDKDGNKKSLQKVTNATYNQDEAAYVKSISSCELTPGYYLVQIDLPDLSSLTQVIQVKGEEA